MRREASKTFTDLLVWQKAHQFVLAVYRDSQNYPRQEAYGLTSQFRRAAISVAANIAEGFKRRGKQDKIRFLNVSQASLEECRYYVILARDLKYGNSAGLMDSLAEVSKLLDGYLGTIQNSISTPPS
jgi:four helix bundle protein